MLRYSRIVIEINILGIMYSTHPKLIYEPQLINIQMKGNLVHGVHSAITVAATFLINTH